MNETAATARAIVRVVNSTQTTYDASVSTPTTTDWDDSVSGACIDLDAGLLVPLVKQDACTNVLGRVSDVPSIHSLKMI